MLFLPTRPPRRTSSSLAILPRIERHGRVYFRHVKNSSLKEEFIAEMVALAWKWTSRLAQQGKDVMRFPSAIATFAAKAVRSGRRLCGQETGKDVLSPLAQQRHEFAVQSLPDFSTLTGNPLEDALIDNTVTPVDEQVAFRLDFPQWLSTYSDRDRRIALEMMVGERTLDVSEKYALSPGRISQMRLQFHNLLHANPQARRREAQSDVVIGVPSSKRLNDHFTALLTANAKRRRGPCAVERDGGRRDARPVSSVVETANCPGLGGWRRIPTRVNCGWRTRTDGTLPSRCACPRRLLSAVQAWASAGSSWKRRQQSWNCSRI